MHPLKKMLKLYFIPLLFLITAANGQKNFDIDNLQNSVFGNYLGAKRTTDSIFHPLKYAKSLEEYLSITFPENSNKDGRWVYYKEYGNIQKIEKSIIGKLLPGYTIYKVNLTNYLGWHINQGTCLFLLDSINSKFTFVEPLWYGGINKSLIKLFVGKDFRSKDSLVNFFTELHDLMQIGSSYKFKETYYSDTLIKFDLVYLKGDSFTTGGNGVSSTVNYNDDGVWRKILIEIKDFVFVRYANYNPKGGSTEHLTVFTKQIG
jgi:hypothetical protein